MYLWASKLGNELQCKYSQFNYTGYLELSSLALVYDYLNIIHSSNLNHNQSQENQSRNKILEATWQFSKVSDSRREELFC